MPVPSVHCEARKLAYRQSKEGLVVSFVIHPNDMPDALAVAPLGQRYMLALAAIGDDEQPIETAEPGGITEIKPNSAWPIPSSASQRGKDRYASSTPMEQALVRACRYSKDERFREWLRELWLEHGEGDEPVTVLEAEEHIRNTCCLGRSRGLIAEDQDCYQRFIAMETEYKIATGSLAEPR